MRIAMTKVLRSAKLDGMNETYGIARLSTLSLVTLLSLSIPLAACSSEDPNDGSPGSGGTTASGGGAMTGGSSMTGGAASTGGATASGGSGTGGADPTQVPSDTSAEGIAAFLEAGHYKSWVGDAAPHPATGQLKSHGDKMKVYFNAIAVATHDDPAYQAMTVKELYDASDVQVGIAAGIRTSPTRKLWTYYCKGPQSACETPSTDDPVYEVEEAIAGCANCHGLEVLTPLPEAP